MLPFACGGVYVNFLSDEGADRVRAVYGPAKFDRLAKINAAYDPDNLSSLTDRRTWDERSTVDLYGFAVDPPDPDHVVGGAPAGVVESSDGGRTGRAGSGRWVTPRGC
jgi:Berberine and berberine like